MARQRFGSVLAIALLVSPLLAGANPPVPSGPHPRLFMSPANASKFFANAKLPGTAASRLVVRCQRTIDHPKDYQERGGNDGDNWPGSAVACAFAYAIGKQPKHLKQALTYWKASLNDDQTIGDNLGCTVANSTYDWKNKWNGNDPRPPALVTIMHDTGYPIRWYGPYIALTYDWLYDAPGVDETLRAQTRACLTAWIDFYTLKGYLHDQAGFNYNAGFVVAKTLGAIAIGTDGGADGHLWTETIRDVFEKMLVGKGLAGAAGGTPNPGLLVGGDWGSWQYGPLSVAEYAASARAMEDHGVNQPEMAGWIDSLIVRNVHGSLPKMDSQFVGNGDFAAPSVYHILTANQVDAVLIGPSSERAAAWALFVKQRAKLVGDYFWNALGEIRKVAPEDYRAQTPPPPLWYVARGTGNMYVRSSWREDAFWGVFMSGNNNGDHQHFAASNFVFSRGGDHLIVDSSNYGEPSTFETNAVSADAAVTPEWYALSQTPWGLASLPWARGTGEGVFAARSEFGHAFDFNGVASDIRYAQREWVMLPEGEIITIDRVHTSADSRGMYVSFHLNTRGTLRFDGPTKVALGSVGGSRVAIHPVHLSGGAPKIVQPPVGGCKLKCNFPCGACDAARFPVDEYSVKVPGSWAVAIHAIDGLAAGERPAQVGSLNDDTVDPPPKQNGGVIGAAVNRASKQSYVVASSARDGAPSRTMTYAVPGGSPARHIVYDAPEARDGTSAVAASASGGRCVVSISAGSGGGLAAHPLLFRVASAADGCAVTPERDAPAAETPAPGGGRRRG